MIKVEKRILFVFLAVFAVIVAILVFASTATQAKMIAVDNSGGQQYTTIQAAINASGAGDTVYVYGSIYNEALTVSKSISIVGENNQNTIIKGTGASISKGIYITASSVNISNLKVDNFYYGVYLSSSSNNNIIENIIANCNSYGIYLGGSSNNTIISNTVSNCSNYGISLSGANNNIMSNTLINSSISVLGDNIISDNTINNKPLLYYNGIDATNTPVIIDNVNTNGIFLYNCKGFQISNLNIEYGGITIQKCSNIQISYVNVSNCPKNAVYVSSSSLVSIANSTITNNGEDGVYLSSVDNSTICSSTFKNNDEYGIYVSGSTNIIESNNIVNNNNSGIYLSSGSDIVVSFNNIHGNKNYGLSYSYMSIGNMTYGIGSGNTAANNWWGSSSGPYCQAGNTNGKGDNFTSLYSFTGGTLGYTNVLSFSPWATSQLDITKGIYAANSTVGGASNTSQGNNSSTNGGNNTSNTNATNSAAGAGAIAFSQGDLPCMSVLIAVVSIISLFAAYRGIKYGREPTEAEGLMLEQVVEIERKLKKKTKIGTVITIAGVVLICITLILPVYFLRITSDVQSSTISGTIADGRADVGFFNVNTKMNTMLGNMEYTNSTAESYNGSPNMALAISIYTAFTIAAIALSVLTIVVAVLNVMGRVKRKCVMLLAICTTVIMLLGPVLFMTMWPAASKTDASASTAALYASLNPTPFNTFMGTASTSNTTSVLGTSMTTKTIYSWGFGLGWLLNVIALLLMLVSIGYFTARRPKMEGAPQAPKTTLAPPQEASEPQVEWGDTPAYKPVTIPCRKCTMPITITSPQRPITVTCHQCRTSSIVRK